MQNQNTKNNVYALGWIKYHFENFSELICGNKYTLLTRVFLAICVFKVEYCPKNYGIQYLGKLERNNLLITLTMFLTCYILAFIMLDLLFQGCALVTVEKNSRKIFKDVMKKVCKSFESSSYTGPIYIFSVRTKTKEITILPLPITFYNCITPNRAPDMWRYQNPTYEFACQQESKWKKFKFNFSIY